MNNRFMVFFMALIAMISFSAFTADDDPFLALIKKLEEYTKKYPVEKVHLHLDKPYYAIGDNIWFKAYVTDSRTTAPSTHSKALYVELIDEKDSIRRQLKLPLQSGIGWGDFALPDTLSEGNYRIRAYTQLMRNAGPDFFFDKTLKVGSSWANTVFVHAQYQLIKEGNNEKVNSTLHFTDKAGKPYVNREVNYKVVLSDRTIHSGRAFTGKNGEIYIPIVNTQPGLYKAGQITAKITLDNKSMITKIVPLKTTSGHTDVSFFPESGNLVAGLPVRIAFKAVNGEGKGEDIKGIIIDNEGLEVTTLESTHLGMGSFYLNPMVGKTYKARITFKNSTEKVFDLPKAESSGYVLAINNNDSTKVGLKVLLTDDVKGKGDLWLLAQQNGNVYFSVKIPTAQNYTTASLPKSQLPSGVITFTLFNAALLPVAERLIFVNNPADRIQVQAGNLKSSYAKREAVDLNFSGMAGQIPVRGSYSVSVTRNAAVIPDPENETNILTSLLLKSDLRGYIEKPNLYFLSNDAKSRTALDHLLLTQGWRKINWKMLGASSWPEPVFPAETDLKISGTVTTMAGKPVARGKVSLFSSAGGLFAIDTLTDANGRFSFDKLQFPDSIRFVIQARNEKGKKDVKIDLDQITRQHLSPNMNSGDIAVNVNEDLKSYLQNSDDYFNELIRRGLLNRTIRLQQVNIVGEKKMTDNSANLNGAGRADAVITAKDLENVNMLSFYLSGRVAGITIREGQAYSRQSTSPMRIVLDGVMMQDMLLDEINVIDIETIEVLKGIGTTAIYGSGGVNGVLVITTKRGTGTSSATYAPGIITHSPKGYNISRQFYSPHYDVTPDTKPDLRTTVFWDPAILADEQGEFKLKYFNTDEPGVYRIVIEGIDAAGHLARQVYTYDVY